jgi:hypothetical protein
VIQISGNQGDFAQAIFNVTRGAFIQLSGINGGIASFGLTAKGPVGTHVNVEGSYFLSTDTMCTVSGPSSGTIIQAAACATFIAGPGPFLGFTNVTASFVVGNVPEGQYLIQVSGNQGDFAQAIFNVTRGAFIQLSPSPPGTALPLPASGPVGVHVSFSGSFFVSTDTTCTVSSPSGGTLIQIGACSVFKVSSGSFLGFDNVTGSFTVGNVLPGQYVVQVNGNQGDFAQAIFNVTLGARITLSPASGQIGLHILVNGTGFLPFDSSCTIFGPGSSVVLGGTAACVTQLGTGVIQGSFTVGNVLPGQYVIQVNGNQGDFAQGILNVTLGPRVTLSPASAAVGIHILVNGTGFLPTDTSCSITGIGNVVLAGTVACSRQLGTTLIQGSFTVGNVLPGQYLITATGNGGDYGTAILNVTLGATITLSPATGQPGFHVAVNGTGFLPTDSACTVSSPGSPAVLPGSQACVLYQVGNGKVASSFTIGNVLPGQYVIQVTGNQGDFAQALLNVTGGPRIAVFEGGIPPGLQGSHVTVSGHGFLPTDQSCSISSPVPSGGFNPILPGSAGCVIAVGTGIVNGSFLIGVATPGQYVIEVTGCTGNNGCAPSVGDFAQAILNVTQGAPGLNLIPSSSTNGVTVSFRATGLSPSDTGCVVQAVDGTGASNTKLITSPTCSIGPSTIAVGSFVVGPYATQDIAWVVQVLGTPLNDITSAPFNVTASIVVTPTSGTINSVFTFTGTGFSSLATSCTAVIVPPFPAPPPTVGCYLTPAIGTVSGSLVVPTTAIPGTYGITVTDNALLHPATSTGFFTVGTPSAFIQIDPNPVSQGQSVGVAGTGFNPADTYCTITAGAGTSASIWGPASDGSGVSPTCAISGGYASGAFTVSNTAVGGFYLITITGYTSAANATRGDFASNFLGINLASTITTDSATTTTATSTTSITTTSTSVATTYSYSSTTYSTTGIFFTSYSYVIINTVSGLTTSTMTQTISTSATMNTVTVSTTTQFTTVSCGPIPCGFAIKSQGVQGVNLGPFADNVGLLAVLLLIIPMLLRRLLS